MKGDIVPRRKGFRNRVTNTLTGKSSTETKRETKQSAAFLSPRSISRSQTSATRRTTRYPGSFVRIKHVIPATRR